MSNDKSFIITVDTEGDNLWRWKDGDAITTENTVWLSRFQKLCNEYGFKPVWLSNYEMVSDDRFADFIAGVEEGGLGELGMHLHAWNNPPVFDLERAESGAPYLIEYPADVMEEKIAFLTEFIKKRTGITPVSHRAGRWAMNGNYYDLLIKYGYEIDCSVTPHVDWRSSPGMTAGSAGSNYQSSPEEPYWIEGKNGGKLLEVPVTVRCRKAFIRPSALTAKSLLKEAYHSLKPRTFWLRPNGNNENEMLDLISREAKGGKDYVMFMIHSSELMPGGSPTFRTQDDIEKLYATLNILFREASESFKGTTLKEYHAGKKTGTI